MNLELLQAAIWSHHRNNEKISHPFLVEAGEKKYFVWFSYTISGKSVDSLRTAVNMVYIADEQFSVEQYNVDISTPSFFSTVARASSQEYLVALSSVCDDFSEEAMNALFQKMEYAPLFDAYLSVKKYVVEMKFNDTH